MKKKVEEQALSNLLKRAIVQAPGALLTEHIIEQIQQEQLEAKTNDLPFEKVIKTAEISDAPSNLTHKVISTLESQKQKSVAHRPLIHKKVKIVYAALMSVSISYMLFTGTFSLSNVFEKFASFSSNSTLLITSCLCLIAFAFLDVFLKKRNAFNMY